MSEVGDQITLRVGFVVPYLQTLSGWHSLSVGVIQSLQDYADVSPVALVSREDADQARTLLPDCDLVIIPRTQFMSLQNPRTWPAMVATYWKVKTCRFPQVDLVHSLEAYPSGLVGHWLAEKLHVPHVITAAGTYSIIWHESRLDRRVYRTVLRRATAICPISHGTASMMRRYFGDTVSEPGLQVVLIGTDYHRQVPRGVALQHSGSIIPTVLSVGAVKPRKGYHVSLAAFAKVKSQLPTARYWIVGHPSNSTYCEQLQQYIADHQLQDVEFLGAVSHEKLQECYQQASVFLLAPQQQGLNFEGFGLVYLEAGAYGLPVVGTRTGGVPDAVRDGETGFLAEPDDVDGLTRALLCLLTDAELARQMGRANREWAETLTWERYAREQAAIYQKVARH